MRNMNRKVWVFAIMFLPVVSFSQVRNLTGMSSFGFGVGAVRYGYQLNINYERIIVPKLSLKGELQLQKSSYQTIDYETYNVYAGVNYNFWNISEVVYFKAGGGLTGSYNYIVDLPKLNETAKSTGINYGFYIEPEVDIFLYRSLILNVNGKQVYQIGDFLGHFYWVSSIGVKFQF